MSCTVGPIYSHIYTQPINSPQSEVIIAAVKELETELSEKENYHLNMIKLGTGVEEHGVELLAKGYIRALAQDVRDKLKEMQASNCHARELKTEFNKLMNEFETSCHFFTMGILVDFHEAQREVNERNKALADKVEKTTLNSAPFIWRYD